MKDEFLKSQLQSLSEEKFFAKMCCEYVKDTNPDRMTVAIEVMAERFGKYPKAEQLTWALVNAISKKNIAMIDFLLDQGALINGTKTGYIPGLLGPASFNPLGHAIDTHTPEIVNRLIAKGADVNNPLSKGGGYIYSAVVYDSVEMVEALLQAGCKENIDHLLRSAMHQSNPKMWDVLIDSGGCDIGFDNQAILKGVIQDLICEPDKSEEHRKKLDYCLARGADIKVVRDVILSKDIPYAREHCGNGLLSIWERCAAFIDRLIVAQEEKPQHPPAIKPPAP